MSMFFSVLLCLAIWVGTYVNVAKGFWHPLFLVVALVLGPLVAYIHQRIVE